MSVTTTSARSGKFESRFWHKLFEEEVGRVRGHLCVAPTRFDCEVELTDTAARSTRLPCILKGGRMLLALRTGLCASTGSVRGPSASSFRRRQLP